MKKYFHIFILTLSILFLPHAAFSVTAFEPYLVKDLVPDGGDTRIWNETVIGDTLFFVVEGRSFSEYGTELWKSDGTADGTVLVKDIRPGSDSSEPEELINVNGTLFFTADDGVHGRELWISDGTSDGTVMVCDCAEGKFSSHIENIISYKGKAFFQRGYDLSIEYAGLNIDAELYSSDGTQEGTKLVKEINPYVDYIWDIPYGSEPRHLFVAGDVLYFLADDATHGEELWKTDGTELGTVMVKDMKPGREDGFGQSYYDNVPWAYLNGLLLFSYDDGVHGKELWKSDGTDVGTTIVKDIYQGAASSALYRIAAIDDYVLFGARDDEGYGLWRSDGTEFGTELIIHLNVRVFASIGDKVVFTADYPDGSYPGLWVSDGTLIGTYQLKGSERRDYISGLYAFGNKALFTYDYQSIWLTDGTVAGTYQLFKSEFGFGGEYIYVADKILFTYEDGIHGAELWASSLSPDSAEMVVDLTVTQGTDSRIDDMALVNGSLLFTACTQQSENPGYPLYGCYKELWKSNSTTEGTTLVWSEKEQSIGDVVASENALFFDTHDGENTVIYRSYGTPESTVPVWRDVDNEHGDVIYYELDNVIDNTLYFSVKREKDYVYTIEVWQSKGDAGNTEVLYKRSANYLKHRVCGDEFVKYNEFVYFPCDDGDHGPQLWKTDGTPEGTQLAFDINTSNSAPRLAGVAGNLLLFNMYDLDLRKWNLWRSDGELEGTYILAEEGGLIGELDGSIIFSWVEEIYDPYLGIQYVEHYSISDGTQEGTSNIDMPMEPETAPVGVGYPTSFNGSLYFSAANKISKRELWKTDGTEVSLVADLEPNEYDPFYTSFYGNSYPHHFVVADNLLFFLASSDEFGKRMWMMDSFESPAPLDNNLINYWGPAVYSDGRLLFVADDGIHGYELWAMNTNIFIGDCNTGITDKLYEGQYITTLINQCADTAKNHGEFVNCVAHLSNELKKEEFITNSEEGVIQSCAAQSNFP